MLCVMHTLSNKAILLKCSAVHYKWGVDIKERCESWGRGVAEETWKGDKNKERKGAQKHKYPVSRWQLYVCLSWLGVFQGTSDEGPVGPKNRFVKESKCWSNVYLRIRIVQNITFIYLFYIYLGHTYTIQGGNHNLQHWQRNSFRYGRRSQLRGCSWPSCCCPPPAAASCTSPSPPSAPCPSAQTAPSLPRPSPISNRLFGTYTIYMWKKHTVCENVLKHITA